MGKLKFKSEVEKRFFEFISDISSVNEEEMITILRSIITDIRQIRQDMLDLNIGSHKDFERLGELADLAYRVLRAIMKVQNYVKYYDLVEEE